MRQASFPREFDYIIVGGGSSGCVLANRLSADPRNRVCLIEEGGRDNTPRIQIPAGTLTLYKSRKLAYQFFSVPQPGLDNRRIHVPRGRGLGGSSIMNSMIYIRGDRSDYDGWSAQGCAGWDYASVLKYFMKSEHDCLGLDPRFHGVAGELDVTAPREANPLSRMFIKAAEQAGQAENPDFNGGILEGVGIYNVTQRDGKRLSAYRAFVHPIRHRPNLHIVTGVTVKSLVIRQGRVEGVNVVHGGQRSALFAQRETVLSAGAIGSPAILMASGIGRGDDLMRAGISVIHDLPGVGQNLQDHLDGLVTVRSDEARSLGFSWKSLPAVLSSPHQYALWRKGWLTTNYVEAGGFARTKLADGVPDVQFHFVPGFRSHRGRLFEMGHGFAIHTCVLRPRSRGEIRPGRNGARDIQIDFRFLHDPRDGEVLREGIRLARQIIRAPAFDGIRGREMAPGPEVVTDDELMAYIRRSASTVFHPAGTCRMGMDGDAVVTPELKVRGMTGLRIADASIMPTLVSGNTNAPCIMIAEKAADMILSDRRR
ncbi:GMC family oxidoreductase [Komagataeibacter swingsii]|uniref:Alcohol dehydrogenase n=1 Tax=Komagataeibacter swingsii TaxID=215220 RepID=A0A2V4RG32_9PROT|nr:GMC family oxidoreductase N-terminal domain-containing protein [Komagataeibacter swingsii]PYD70905.1 alcohol dehydrogenase [Komagataeibacter swingsii]GBQ60770.1 alcohol dehydrogenase [Komagataeibacter swingsii DSM 16373]